MKTAVISTAFSFAIASVAIAETGGYPASPSHGITGQNPDGTPRYGSELDKGARPPDNTVGGNGSNAAGDRSSHGTQNAGKEQRK
ncbi:hypothetical protein [Bradyrhizobium sp. ARR65]|uniref:hypothetical protein n=1 Tax=Bradyrhizobium sp. ARR65 TaxID=1040989 RepID=UPI0004663758|nr:hypothetical protein [Bradyrhizobium sp. ARR65]